VTAVRHHFNAMLEITDAQKVKLRSQCLHSDSLHLQEVMADFRKICGVLAVP
jgi:hypothetical protein